MKSLIFVLSLFLSLNFFSQDIEETSKQAGTLELGVRNTLSLFENDGHTGVGFGGQFRLWLGNKLNTEWYSDYIKTDIGGLGNRNTVHIGWSVMFYPLEANTTLSPYFVAGHCFDYAKITIYDGANTSKERKSSAIQLGIGNSFRLSKRMDISLSAQYMMHIGDDIHTSVINVNGTEQLTFDTNNSDGHNHSHTGGLATEGHILVTASLNFKLVDLW